MAEKKKEQEKPRHLIEDRVRVCGKWQKKGYKPTDEEVADYERKQEIAKGNRPEKAKADKK